MVVELTIGTGFILAFICGVVIELTIFTFLHAFLDVGLKELVGCTGYASVVLLDIKLVVRTVSLALMGCCIKDLIRLTD